MKISLIRKRPPEKKKEVESFSVLPTVGAIPTAIWFRQRILVSHPAIIFNLRYRSKRYQPDTCEDFAYLRSTAAHC